MTVHQTRYYCDICKKEMFLTEGIWPVRKPKQRWFIGAEEYDVCRECHKALKKFIESRKEN